MASWTSYQILLAFLMLITGSINTLSTKWADNSYAKGSDGQSRQFTHPFLQAVGMFLGEFLCLVVFNILFCHRSRTNTQEALGNQKFNRLIFMPAAMCDMCGTSLLYIGLTLTYASSFQMLRGAVIVFTALLSVVFLGRKIHKHMWLGIVFILSGLALVGVSDIVFNGAGSDHPKNNIITGDLIIIIAQIVVAGQMVYEEKFVKKYNVPPLQAIGWEGVFGFVLLGILLIPMYFILVPQPFSTDPDGRLENPFEAFTQMANNWQILVATLGNIISIAFFNFSGISVSKELSATTRMVLDSLRTIVIWAVSLGVGWQPFSWQSFLVQATGFALLMVGMFIYNDLLIAPFLRRHGCLSQGEMDDHDSGIVNVDADESSNLLDPAISEQNYRTVNADVYFDDPYE